MGTTSINKEMKISPHFTLGVIAGRFSSTAANKFIAISNGSDFFVLIFGFLLT